MTSSTIPSATCPISSTASTSTRRSSARQMYDAGARSSGWHMLVHPPAAFLRNYVLRRGFMDGTVGLTISLMNSYGVFLKFAKLWEIQRGK